MALCSDSRTYAATPGHHGRGGTCRFRDQHSLGVIDAGPWREAAWAVLLYVVCLAELSSKGKETEGLVREIPGSEGVKANNQGNLSTLRLYVMPARLARYGINPRQGMDAVAT